MKTLNLTENEFTAVLGLDHAKPKSLKKLLMAKLITC